MTKKNYILNNKYVQVELYQTTFLFQNDVNNKHRIHFKIFN